jgi:hypothetical protein
MNTFRKYTVTLSVVFMLSAIPALAQSADVVNFQAPFAFQVGDDTLPPGSYTITQPDANIAVLMFEDADGSHSAFVTYRPVDHDAAPSETMVSFNEYGDVDFLSRISVAGSDTELRLFESQAEQRAAESGTAQELSMPALPSEPLPSAAATIPTNNVGN